MTTHTTVAGHELPLEQWERAVALAAHPLADTTAENAVKLCLEKNIPLEAYLDNQKLILAMADLIGAYQAKRKISVTDLYVKCAVACGCALAVQTNNAPLMYDTGEFVLNETLIAFANSLMGYTKIVQPSTGTTSHSKH